MDWKEVSCLFAVGSECQRVDGLRNYLEVSRLLSFLLQLLTDSECRERDTAPFYLLSSF